MREFVFPSDLRDAWRSLAARPGFSLLLLLTLGLGIGATTTIVSFTYALLFRPYPYEAPERLVRVQTVATKHGGARQDCSLRDVEDYRRRASRLADVGAYTVFDTRLLTDGPPEVISMSQLNPQALSLLGVRPIVGRLLRPEEDLVGGDVHKVVLSYDLWMTRFGGDRAIAGKPFRTDRRTYTIVGVMPPGFRFPDRVDAWSPMESWYANMPPGDERRLKPRERRIYATIARIRADVSLAEAEADLNRVAAELEREFPKENDGFRVALTPLRDFEMGAVRPYALVCAAGVGMVLLIGCVNVANLLLVRAAAQRRVVAVKLALGASAARIARGLLVESLMLGLAGSALGLLFAMAGVQGLLALIPVPLPAWMRITIDAPILLFTIAIGLATAIIFGLVPMMSAARVALTSALREGARGSARSRMRSALVIGEIALSVVLLVGAALLMQTFVRLQDRHPGFEVGGLATARVVAWAPGTRAQSASVLNNIHGRVLSALRNLPGVSVAAVGNDLPYAAARTERQRADVYIRGRAAEETRTIVPIVGTDASADYFSALRIPVRRGRTIDATDTETSEPVIVISERAARMFWPNQDPIGQYLCWGKPGPDNPWTRVVGVVGDVKLHAAEGEVGIELYYPITQWPVASSYYVVRTTHDPDQMLDTIRRTILTADPTLAVRYVKTLERAVTESLWQRRLWGVLFTAFSVLAVGLAAVGVYGVVSYAVAQREREMGIRLALGAAPGRVRGLVIRESMGLCAIGIVAGLAGAFALARAMSGLLFGVPPHDPVTFVVVTVTIGAVCLVACWVPALHASRVNPITALRDGALVLALLAIATPVWAQAPGTIEGTVLAQANQEPVPEAVAFLEDRFQPVTTDRQGRFRLNGVPPGSWTLVIQRAGFAELRQSLTVNQGQTSTVTIELTSAATLTEAVTVTATRHDEQLRSLPVSVGAVSGEELRHMRPAHVAEPLNRIPGVQFVAFAGEGAHNRLSAPAGIRRRHLRGPLVVRGGEPQRSRRADSSASTGPIARAPTIKRRRSSRLGASSTRIPSRSRISAAFARPLPTTSREAARRGR